jgi:hypothetical protein
MTDRTNAEDCLIRLVLERGRPRPREYGGESPPLHSLSYEVNAINFSTIYHLCSAVESVVPSEEFRLNSKMTRAIIGKNPKNRNRTVFRDTNE